MVAAISNEELCTETVMVTPEMARVWLEQNTANRPLSRRQVEAIAWDIQNGKWRLTHQGIAFNKNFALVDGQHRLHAIVMANKTVSMRVTYNLEAEFSTPIDTGYMRTVSHVLGVSRRMVAVCNALSLLESGEATRMSPGKIETTYDRHCDAVAWALDVFPARRRLNANVLAAHAYAFPAARDLVADFATKVVSGANIGADSPVLLLRKHLEREERYNGERRVGLMQVVLRCLQAHCEGKPFTKFYETDAGFEYFARRRAEMGV